MAENRIQEIENTAGLPLSRDLSFILIQFLREEGFHETAHRVERESRVYFDLCYLEEKLLNGAWIEAEWYINGYFADIQHNSHALGLLFEIYKQKYIEALFSHETGKALDILKNELCPLVSSDNQAYKELALLLSLDEARQNQLIERWGNMQNARALMCVEIRKILFGCPDLQDKLNFPSIPPFRLRSLLSQSFDWQHHLCLRKQPNPVMTTLLQDHNCSQSGPAQDFLMSPTGPSRPTGASGSSTSEGALHFNYY